MENTPKILENKVAIVTGASRGIGKQIALTFADAGAKLILCATKLDLLEQVAADIEAKSGNKPLTFAFDVRDSNHINDVVKKTLDTHNRIDILVNNAGLTRDQLLALMSEDDWDTVLSVNLKSVFLFTKAVAKKMLRQRYGRIINMSSIVGVGGNAGQANYAASKAGIIAFTRSVAKEIGKRGITVNSIAPGFIQTDMTNELGEDAIKAMINHIPLGRLGEPKDIANAALFLASDQSGYITGQVLRVDGGLDF